MPQRPILCLIESLGKGGGAEHLIATLAPRLRAIGVPLEVAALQYWPINYEAELADAGVPVHVLYGSGRAGRVPALAKLARQRGYGLFWGHLIGGIAHARLGAALTAGKSIATLHSPGPAVEPPRRLRDKLATRWHGGLMGGASARVAVSQAVADQHGAWFGWNDIAVAYNGVDLDLLQRLAATQTRAQSRARWGIGADEFLVVTPARFVARKGQLHLLEALALLRDQGCPPIRLLMAGEGADRSPLHADVVRLGLDDAVIIRDVIEQPQLMPLLAHADLFVLPSLAEPFGIVAAEAMALSVPAIVSAVEGLREVVGGADTAMTFPAGDAATLAAHIRTLREDPGRARAMGGAGAARIASRFGIDTCAQRWAEIFAAVQDNRPIPPCAA